MADSKKYNGSTWEHSLRKLTTATEAVENPLYSDGTAITAYTIKGNTVQDGTPSPSAPVPVVGVGELETTGEHTGEYKIPISSGGVTTDIYLGSTQTVKRIKKLVLTGQEDWILASVNSHGIVNFRYPGTIDDRLAGTGNVLSSHLPMLGTGNSDVTIESVRITATNIFYLRRFESEISTVTGLQTWLAQQYANGTPVTVWYVLATPETAAVNEPLMKIGNYADTLSNAAQIPTTEGANSITVDTTVQPSEFTVTWTGWHNSTVKAYDGANWN